MDVFTQNYKNSHLLSQKKNYKPILKSYIMVKLINILHIISELIVIYYLYLLFLMLRMLMWYLY